MNIEILNIKNMKKDNKSEANLRRQKAEELIKKEPPKSSFHLSADKSVLIHELEVHQIELEMQNDELMLANEKTTSSIEKYTELYDFAPLGYFTLSKKYVISDINHIGANMLGKDRSKLKNSNFLFFVSDDSKLTFLAFIDKVFQGETKETCELIISTNINTPLYVFLSGIVSENREYCLVCMIDLTERKLAEEALKTSEEKYRMLLNLAPDAFFQGDSKGCFSDVNNQAIELTGYSRQELLKMNIKDLFSTEDLKHNGLQYEKLEEAKSLKSEREVLCKNGGKIFVEMNSRKMPDGTYQSFFRDISERKKTDEELRTTKIVFDSSIAANSIADIQGNLIEANKAFLTTWGYQNRNEVIGKPIASFLNSDNDTRKILNSLLLEGSWDGTYTAKRSDGSTFIAHSLASILRDETGRAIGYNSSVTDITDRRQAEEALQSSEARLRKLIHSIPDMVWLKDTNGRYLACNKKMEQYFNANESEIIGKTDYDFVSEEIADTFRDGDFRAMEAGKPTHKEEWILYPDDGRLTFLDTIKTPIYDSTGIIIGVLGIGRDFTDQKQVEEALRISEEKYKRMLKAAPASVVFIGLNGIINEISGIELELFGAQTREDIVGKHFLLFVSPDEKTIIRSMIKKTINNGIAQNIELNLVKRDKTKFLGEIQSSLIKDQNGTILAFMVSVRNVSKRKETEAKLYHIDRLASLGEVSAGLAHEINQPLNMIYMIIDKILFEYANTEVIDIELLKKQSDKIYGNINRVKKILNHIKGFSRSQKEILTSTFDINSSIENAVMMISSQFKNLGIKLSTQLSENLQVLAGNTYRFEQVIINLLGNAKDAVIDMNEMAKVEVYEMVVGIKSYRDDNEIIIEISDNGIGIDNDNLKELFVPYYSTKDESKGTGLGLPICYQIIKEMNGTIEISSERFYGTTVRIVFNI
jgi:PAS domain S-box-containing protein